MDIAELDELARIHHRDVVTEPSNDTEIMADEQEGNALVPSEARQQAQDLRLDRDVEGGRRLVEDQERRFADERGGDQRALLHPARKLVRKGSCDFGSTIDPHFVQCCLGASEGLGQRQPEMLHHGLGDLPADTKRWVERCERILKDSTDLPAEHLPTLRRREADNVLALEQDRAADLGFGAEKVENGAGHAALAGPGLADNGERATGLDREADVAYRGDLPRALAVADRQIADLEQRFGGRRRQSVHQRTRSPGSSISRKPSPTRLIAITVMLIAIPGASEIRGAVSTKARPLLIIKPQSAAGGCTPKPRKLSTAPSSTANTTRRLASTISTGQTLGISSRINM